MCEQCEHEKKIIANTARAEMKLAIIREFNNFMSPVVGGKKTKREIANFIQKIANL